jgi:hypothetical protein
MERRSYPAILAVALVLIGLMAAGCGKPPEVEMQSAQTALNDAKTAEAGTYAPTELDAASDSLAAAQAEVEKQNSKFALFRNYKEAARLYSAAQTSAEAAKQAAGVNKERRASRRRNCTRSSRPRSIRPGR